jgi:hypothetical protein
VLREDRAEHRGSMAAAADFICRFVQFRNLQIFGGRAVAQDLNVPSFGRGDLGRLFSVLAGMWYNYYMFNRGLEGAVIATPAGLLGVGRPATAWPRLAQNSSTAAVTASATNR